ncbi:hypothetical protein ONS96_009477 [Cadophora gregata f. sp. sojae]|nr:hypothetical protein ONS96_009477 [Cadophora gregata f. sp. sojae]
MSPTTVEDPKATALGRDIETACENPTTDRPECREEDEDEKETYLPWKKVAVIMIGAYCTMFIVAQVVFHRRTTPVTAAHAQLIFGGGAWRMRLN